VGAAVNAAGKGAAFSLLSASFSVPEPPPQYPTQSLCISKSTALFSNLKILEWIAEIPFL
jgi:hypothetical protein